uniref:BHLH domain-containing protein n=1 Tax=Opuntia streptacantha TaxID=393608 RepID=A0A7C9D056_OPUST
MALEAAVAYQYHHHPPLFGQNIDNEKFDFLYPLLLQNCASSSSSSSIDYLLDNNTQSSSQNFDDWHHDYTITGINDGNFWDNCNFYEYNYPCVDSLDEYQYQDSQWRMNSTPKSPLLPDVEEDGGAPAEVERPKRRRRARAKKNKEEIENQRMTHIAVERNRRKQMNDYLSVLRSLMPDSYVQRGDQASVIGGAINFVKELEQNLQCLSARKHINENDTNTGGSGSSSSLPFGEFFSFPQYSGTTSGGGGGGGGSGFAFGDNDHQVIRSAMSHCLGGGGSGGVAADVEVTMVESHALLKIRTRRPPKQLSKLVLGVQGLRLTILHLNVSKLDGVALYSFSVRVEEESKLGSVDEIAGAVYQLLGRIQDEAGGYF